MRIKYTEDDYIRKCLKLGLEYIGNHKVYKLGTMINFICPKHRSKGIQSKDWSHFKTYTYGCSYCSGRGKTNEDIIPLIKNKDVELISKYKGNEKPIDCRCRKCGNEWTTLPKVLITNGSGCPICGRLKAVKSETKTKEQFIKELKEVNPNIEALGNYVNTHTKIKCRCKIDGAIWNAYPANLLNNSAGCPCCNMSVGERMLLDILKKLNINFVSQYIIDGCKLIFNLKFDAFDIDNNIAFEYNGEQHYKPIDFAGKGEEWARQEFEKIVKRDNVKIEYCRNNNIPMIVVPYWERDNMESYIINKLNELKNIN
jgi:hypothetical protein